MVSSRARPRAHAPGHFRSLATDCFDATKTRGLRVGHAARAYARESEYTEDEALRRIVDMFEAEIARPTDMGSTTPRSQQGH